MLWKAFCYSLGALVLGAVALQLWFFGHILAEVQGANVKLQIEEAKPPHGNGRVTPLEDWGLGSLKAAAASPSPAGLRKSGRAF